MVVSVFQLFNSLEFDSETRFYKSTISNIVADSCEAFRELFSETADSMNRSGIALPGEELSSRTSQELNIFNLFRNLSVSFLKNFSKS